MIYSSEGVRPDPEKVKALENIPPPMNKKDLRSFVCMMQSNGEFIPNFAKKIHLFVKYLLAMNALNGWIITKRDSNPLLMSSRNAYLFHTLI